MNGTADDAIDSRRTDINPTHIEVSAHARLRTMMRLGVVERAAEHVRELLAKAEPADPEFVTAATVYKIGGVYLILDPAGETVQTVLKKGGRDDG